MRTITALALPLHQSLTQKIHSMPLCPRPFGYLVSSMQLILFCNSQLLLAIKRSKALFAEDGFWACNTLAQNLRAEGYVIKAHGPGTDNQCKKSKRQCLETLSHNYLTCSGFGSNTYEVSVKTFLKASLFDKSDSQDYCCGE